MRHMRAAKAAFDDRQGCQRPLQIVPLADRAAAGKNDLPLVRRIGNIQPLELGNFARPVDRVTGSKQHIDKKRKDDDHQGGHEGGGADCPAPPAP